MKDEALKKALHELEGIPVYRKYGVRISNASTVIKEALAQPAQEPDCPKCGNNRQVWNNQITGLKTCHRVNCHTVIQNPAQEPVFDWLPETTTHINRLVVDVQSGGNLVTRFNAFKYEDGLLMVYHTDNENEYPEWIAASRKFKHTYFPVFSIASPSAQPEQKLMHPELRKMWEDYFDKCFRAMPLPEPVAQNFCPRCGKRTPDLTTIHTCTPPRGLEMA